MEKTNLDEKKLEEYKLEIMALQRRDQEIAEENGFLTKNTWFDYIIEQETDEIALALLSMAERYEIPFQRVAYDFDRIMIMRVTKMQKKAETQHFGKAA